MEIDAQGRDVEVAAIMAVVKTVEHATNNESPDEFLSVFRDDAMWTTGGGRRFFGVEAIGAFTRQVLPGGMAGMTLEFELEHIVFIREDVAAIKLRQIYRGADGVDVGTPLWVLAKEDGRWLLTAAQNMGAPDDEVDAEAGNRPVFGTS
ncbi:SgcJ/EcaC family oxidoreductase [Kribbella sp. NPDC048915]|uniref:SgcJ/EcaC family oxidoreductase n=1 Tax=Kribbella sp. NPDC048915 TaxID=3155148 RepID=UPI0033F0BC18